jgi:glycosyltransferase involved in cell wall biosynthesis
MVKNDRNEFTARLIQLLEDRELYRAKSAEARRHARRWALDRITEKLTGIYREAPAIMERVR